MHHYPQQVAAMVRRLSSVTLEHTMAARSRPAHNTIRGLATRQYTSSSSPTASPYVCTACRMRVAPIMRNVPRRTFTTTLHRRQKTEAPSAAQSPPQTHYDFFPETFPAGPPPHSPFTPDLKQLRREFLQLQAKAHPDLAPADQKRRAEALSMRINEAYRTLQDPLRRAQYLLQHAGIDVEDDSAKLAENALLMEVMEAREAVEEVQDEAELGALRAENDERIAGSVQALEEAFSQGDMERAAEEAVRLRYWRNIEESIVGWEKGQGGGILHH